MNEDEELVLRTQRTTNSIVSLCQLTNWRSSWDWSEYVNYTVHISFRHPTDIQSGIFQFICNELYPSSDPIEPAYPLSDEEEEKAEKDLYYRFPM